MIGRLAWAAALLLVSGTALLANAGNQFSVIQAVANDEAKQPMVAERQSPMTPPLQAESPLQTIEELKSPLSTPAQRQSPLATPAQVASPLAPPAGAAPRVEPLLGPALVPPDDKMLLIIGQDTDSIDAYVQAFGQAPGGVTGYTSLSNLEGLTSVAEYGSGPHHLDYLAAAYPESTLAVGLFLVDYLDEISDGKADAKIDELLDILAGYERPVYLRFGYEFDGSWNRYDPEQFKQAWIYFHDKMTQKGVQNVAMVWQSAAACPGTYGMRPIRSWYPGDEYVDWVGLSYFVQRGCRLEPVREVVDFARERGKPVMIAEATPQRYAIEDLTFSLYGRRFESRTAEQIWFEWFAPFFTYIHQNRDIIRAVAYINAHWDEQPMWGPPYRPTYWGDSRVEAHPFITERWRSVMAEEKWLQASPALVALPE
jgi:hypothetical protein